MPHHCSTICLVGNTMNHGERGGRGIWEAGGKGSPSWIRVTYYWETHLWEEPPVGPGVRRKVCVPVVVHKEGGVSPGAGSRHCAPIYQAQCVPPWDAGDQATLSKATTDLLGFFGPLSVGVDELLRTRHFRDVDHSPCSLLPAPQGLISGFLMSQARYASTKCPCPVFPSCPPGSKGEGTLASLRNEQSSSVSI